MELSFFGAARTVTGSKHLLRLNKGLKILLDCGMFQGLGERTHELNRHFGFDPAEIDMLILTHAHIDHSGLIPLLVKHGFTGPVYCTPATYDLCSIMLLDSAHIQEMDVKYVNKRRVRKHLEPYKPLYTVEDAKRCLRHFVGVEAGSHFSVDEDVDLLFTPVGHILGAAAINLTIREDDKTTRLAYTGDIGRPNPPIISPPEPFPQCDYLITESTYGDRLHEATKPSLDHFLTIVIETCVLKKGKLIIPAFSVGRTQEIVYALDRLENEGRLPHIPVFVDSPLSTNATEIMRKHSYSFNKSIQEYMEKDPDPFGFNRLTYVTEAEASKKMNRISEPCIIISASGMAEAGRIKHHLANNISNPANTILIVGYCEPESLGGRLAAGADEVRIFGENYLVKAHVETITSLSAHGDYEEMLSFLACQDATEVKKVFLVHGQYEVQQSYSLRLMNAGFRNVEIPAQGQGFKL